MGHRRLGLFGPGLFGLITGQHRISVLFFGLSVVLLGLGWSPGFLLAQSPSVLPSYLPVRLETEGVVARIQGPKVWWPTSSLLRNQQSGCRPNQPDPSFVARRGVGTQPERATLDLVLY